MPYRFGTYSVCGETAECEMKLVLQSEA